MDEKETKSLTIGDILDQLVKPSVIEDKGTPPPRPVSLPSSPLPPVQNEPGSGVKIPQLGKTLEEPKSSSSKSPVKSELRLSIRTMSDDLAKLKSGQKISPSEIQKTPIPAPIPKPPPPKPQPLPPPQMPKPPAAAPSPAPSFRPPLSTQPSLPPSRPMPLPTKPATPSPAPMRPILPPVRPLTLPPISAPPSPANETKHYHPEKVIGEEGGLPAFLGAPIPKKVKKPTEEKVEYKLIAKIIGSGMTTGIIITLIMAVTAYGLVYFFYLKKAEAPATTATPTPIETSTAPVINELETIFNSVGVIDFQLPNQKQEALSSLKSFISSQALTKKDFKRLNITLQSAQNQKISSLTDLMDNLSLNYPANLKNETNTNILVLLYGQEELFNVQTDSIPKKLVFIAEVRDLAKISEIMSNWEGSISEDLKELFDIDPSKQASQTFLSNEHRGVQIRYKNFPLPDKTIDYAIVSSLTNHHYLIITNSRESMYSPADKIRGL